MTDTGIIIFSIIGALISFVIAALIMRRIFEVATLLKCQQAQIRLLIEIAKKQGVEASRINEIVEKVNA